METKQNLLSQVDQEVAKGRGAWMIHAGTSLAEPKWQNDNDCAMGGWFSDIHGTLMSPASTDWNQHKPYVYLNVFMPEDRTDPQYGLIYAGKAEVHVDKGQSIVEHNYSGSPGKTNEWRSIVNRAQPHEIVKYVVSVYETVEECRAAEKRLITHLWDRFGRVDDGGIVTNLVLGIEGEGGNATPEECWAQSKQMTGKTRGACQPVFIRESGGTEHFLESLVEAAELVGGLTGLDYGQARSLVIHGLTYNKETLFVHKETGLLICYTKNKGKPMRKTPGDRLVRVEDTVDGTVEVITADEFMARFKVHRNRLSGAAIKFRSHGQLFLSRYAVTWDDGVIEKRSQNVSIFDRVTGERCETRQLVAEGFNLSSIWVSAWNNQSAPYVNNSAKPKGRDADFYKAYFVFESDLDKPITPLLVEKPVALLRDGLVDNVDLFCSGSHASKSLGLSSGAAGSAARKNKAFMVSGKLPKLWRMILGTYVPILLDELPAYCKLTNQEMPFSNLWYVDAIAQWQAENPRPYSKAARLKQAA